MIHTTEIMPCLLSLTKGSQHDHTFLKHLNLAKGSYIVFEKGYNDYPQYAVRSQQQLYSITRMKDNAR